jgi:hypothetical protein
MTPNRITRSLSIGLMILSAFACQRTPPAPSTSASAGTQTAASPGAPATTANEPTAATPTAVVPLKADPCALLSAAEVGAIMGKTLVKAAGGGCTYGLDPTAKEKELSQTQREMSNAQRAGSAGDMSAMMRGMAQLGGKHSKMGSSMMEQLNLTLDATRDDQTEESIKAIYAQTGNTVRGAVAPLSPEKRGLTGLIQGTDDISGVGDWAFATNVASVNMGGMLSIRGRLLEARKGPWHVTLSATVSPDPGVPALDRQLAAIARALLAKL